MRSLTFTRTVYFFNQPEAEGANTEINARTDKIGIIFGQDQAEVLHCLEALHCNNAMLKHGIYLASFSHDR
ncbi:MAG: hypothetical protein ACR5K4_04345 [Sodalis sp. (in: enterobacteria)]